MKCDKCLSPMVWIDAEENLIWCEDCDYTENADYKELPEHLKELLK